jgi:hypothetical protein
VNAWYQYSKSGCISLSEVLWTAGEGAILGALGGSFTRISEGFSSTQRLIINAYLNGVSGGAVGEVSAIAQGKRGKDIARSAGSNTIGGVLGSGGGDLIEAGLRPYESDELAQYGGIVVGNFATSGVNEAAKSMAEPSSVSSKGCGCDGGLFALAALMR